MFQMFLENLKQLSIFILISKTILYFGIGKKFEKYSKLILSFMVVAQFIFSIGSYLKPESKFLNLWSKEQYYQQWEEYMSELELKYEMQQGILADEIQEQNKDIEETTIDSITIEKIEIP